MKLEVFDDTRSTERARCKPQKKKTSRSPLSVTTSPVWGAMTWGYSLESTR
jgi:hypothetical protein